MTSRAVPEQPETIWIPAADSASVALVPHLPVRRTFTPFAAIISVDWTPALRVVLVCFSVSNDSRS